MQLYVDKLPQCCAECQFCYFKDGCGYCLAKFLEPTKPLELGCHTPYLATNKDCPLRSIYGPINQSKRAVCEEIKDLTGNRFDFHWCEECGETDCSDLFLRRNDLNEILDLIKEENQCPI